MKFAINTCYGGYGLAPEYSEYEEMERNDARLIAKIEEVGAEEISDALANITLVFVPDEATDWEIDEYDGYETVRYVLNGKIHYAEVIEDEEEGE